MISELRQILEKIKKKQSDEELQRMTAYALELAKAIEEEQHDVPRFLPRPAYYEVPPKKPEKINFSELMD